LPNGKPLSVKGGTMEIERKYLLKELPDLGNFEHHKIEQAYLCTGPVVRVRREDENYYMTYKGSGMMSREEYNLALTKESYEHLKAKADGNIISKIRYLIPLEGTKLVAEVDVFEEPFAPLILAEVEFESEEAANTFVPPAWFGEDVTFDGRYHNSYMSSMKFD
jgi:CYTH domain-containing protein